jgi:uncharacterized protein (UPF0335 family)
MSKTQSSRANDPQSDIVEIDGAAGKRLKSLIERIERLEEEKAGLATDIKDIYGEAKSVGFDPKIMRKIIRLRKMDADKRSEEEMLLETYKSAVGLA